VLPRIGSWLRLTGGRVAQVWAAKQAVAGGTLGAHRFAQAPRLPPRDGDEQEEEETEQVHTYLQLIGTDIAIKL
jgi:hypothetical protein